MTENEALSVLSALDGEIGALLAQRQAARIIGEVIASYKTARKGLDTLKEDEKNTQASIAALSDRYASENTRLRNEMMAATATYRQEEATAREKAQEARDELESCQHQLAAAEESYAQRSAAIQGQIIDLQTQYGLVSAEFERLKAAFEDWKKQHNL